MQRFAVDTNAKKMCKHQLSPKDTHKFEVWCSFFLYLHPEYLKLESTNNSSMLQFWVSQEDAWQNASRSFHKWDGVWCLTRLPKWVCTTLSQASRIAQDELMERQIIELTWMVGWSTLIKNTSSACLLPEKSKFRTLLGQYLGSSWERCFSFFVAFYEKLWYQNSVWFWSCMFPRRLYLRIIHFARIDCLINSFVFVFSVFFGLYNPDLMQQFAWGSDRKQTQQRPGSWGATTTTSWGQILPWSSSCSLETVSDGAILLCVSQRPIPLFLLFSSLVELSINSWQRSSFSSSSRVKGIRVLGWWAQESQTLREAWKHWISENTLHKQSITWVPEVL